MKEKFGYLFRNVGLLMVSNFATKILTFLMVPLYTSVLSTKEYGIYDLLYTAMVMLIPILSLNIVDAVMRFSIGAEQEDHTINLTAGVKYTVFSVFLLILGVFFGGFVLEFNTIRDYAVEFVLLYTAYSLYELLSQFSRGAGKVSDVAAASFLSTVITIACNLYFLLVLKLGIRGYFYAAILSLLVPDLYLILRGRLYRYIRFDRKAFSISEREKEMLKYCIPLIVINLSWYINNLVGRFVVSLYCGVEANGVYSVAYKIPAILNAVQVVFIQAWQLSAVREFNAKDGEPFYRRTYQGCQIVMTMLCSSLIVGSRILAKILFHNEFYGAWAYVPTLLTYIVFNTLSGTVGGIFTAVKDAKSLTTSALAGAIVNIGLNFVLVYYLGPLGAAIATVVSSVVIWGMRMIAVRNHMVLKLNYWVHILEFAILIIQAALMTTITGVLGYSLQIVLWVALLLLNYYDVRKSNDAV